LQQLHATEAATEAEQEVDSPSEEIDPSETQHNTEEIGTIFFIGDQQGTETECSGNTAPAVDDKKPRRGKFVLLNYKDVDVGTFRSRFLERLKILPFTVAEVGYQIRKTSMNYSFPENWAIDLKGIELGNSIVANLLEANLNGTRIPLNGDFNKSAMNQSWTVSTGLKLPFLNIKLDATKSAFTSQQNFQDVVKAVSRPSLDSTLDLARISQADKGFSGSLVVEFNLTDIATGLKGCRHYFDKFAMYVDGSILIGAWVDTNYKLDLNDLELDAKLAKIIDDLPLSNSNSTILNTLQENLIPIILDNTFSNNLYVWGPPAGWLIGASGRFGLVNERGNTIFVNAEFTKGVGLGGRTKLPIFATPPNVYQSQITIGAGTTFSYKKKNKKKKD
jgi:hypothetical protein